MIKIQGKIIKILPTEKRGSSDNPFIKRIFWLEEVSERYPNTWKLELWKEDDCAMIDNYQLGDYVICYVDIKGQRWAKDGREDVMNTLKCWNFEKEGKSFKQVNL